MQLLSNEIKHYKMQYRKITFTICTYRINRSLEIIVTKILSLFVPILILFCYFSTFKNLNNNKLPTAVFYNLLRWYKLNFKNNKNNINKALK